MNDTNRYHRQSILPEIGEIGQQKIQSAHITIVGLGALGTVTAELLCRAGISSLTIIDRDFVEESNLQRQSLYTQDDIGVLKTKATKKHLTKINSNILIETKEVHLHSENINSIIPDSTQIVLDCTDNMETRFLLNDYCHKQSLPFIYAAAVGMNGSLYLIDKNGPCLRCFMPENAQGETCIQAGVLNTTTHIIAAMQVTKVIQFLIGHKISEKLEYYNSWNNTLFSISIKRNKNCETCNKIYPTLSKNQNKSIKFCSSNKFQFFGNVKDLKKLKNKFDNSNIESNYDGMILTINKIVLFPDGRAIINAKSIEEAESLYSKYIGN